MKEIWKDIPDYEGLYQVSNLGRIKRIGHERVDSHHYLKEKIKQQTLNVYGYESVRLCKNGKAVTKRVHRLVMLAFKGKSNLQIDHIDGNKLNNKLENLEYVTSKENTRRAWQMGLSSSPNNRKIKQYDLQGNFIKEWDNVVEALRSLGRNEKSGNIHNCCSKRLKTAYGYIWEYGDKW